MGKKNFKVFGAFALFAIFLFSMNFVLATTANSTGLTFVNNKTAFYDEGNFSVNWTAIGDAAGNYSIYIFNGAVYAKSINTSSVGYAFNNWTEANYTFTIETANASNGFKTNSTTILMYVDRTAPVIELPLYTNATAKKNTTQLTLNVSVTDAKSGLTGSVCLVNINGTNQSFAVSGGWCNLTDGNLTGLTDGNNIIKIYVNDTVNIVGLNNTFYLVSDTTAPVPSPLCSPSTVTTGDSFPCSCSGSDATAGLDSSLTSESSSSPESISTPLSSGTFVYTCSVTDLAGNSASLTTRYVVEERGSSHPSGSLSPLTTVVTTLPPYTFPTIAAGTSATKEYASSLDMGIKEIQLSVNTEAQNVQVAVTKYDSKPAAVSAEKTGKVYQYLQINVSNVEGKLDKATITTKVEKSWVSSNNLEKENLTLFKFDETSGKWNELSTAYSSEDGTYYYFTTDVTSFSYFAIAEKSLISSGETGTTNPSGETATSATNDLTWLWVAIGAVVLVALITVIMMKGRKKKK